MAPPREPSQFLQDLTALDPGLANRWRARTHDNPAFALDGEDIQFIFWPLFKNGGTVTQRQAVALMKLIESVRIKELGRTILADMLVWAQSDGRLDTAADRLDTADELRPVNNALGMGTIGRISFKSPGTGLSYLPSHYLAIQKLIAKKKITVLEVKIAGLEQKEDLPIKANYRSDINRLFLYQSVAPALRTVVVVHEVTHAIQDWQDVRKAMKFTEADAFIAGTAAGLSQGTNKAAFGNLAFDSALAAAQLVIDNQAVPSNGAWTAAYEQVWHDIEKMDAYKDIANILMATKQRGEGNSEKKQFDDALAALEKK